MPIGRGGIAPVALAAELPEARRAEIERRREAWLATCNDLAPLEGKHRFDQIFHFRIDGKALVLVPLIEPIKNRSTLRVDLEGEPMPARLMFSVWVGRRQGMGSPRFDLFHERYDDDGVIHSMRVFLSRDVRITYRSFGDHLIRDVVFEETADGVSLDASDGNAKTIELHEPDFITFRRRHVRETEAFLRPILRELGQEAVLAPDAAAAWQVLADDWPESPDVRAKVIAQLPDLGNDDFRRREAAAHSIAATGIAGATSVAHIEREGLSPEQNRQLDAILSLYRPLPDDDAENLHDDVPFLLDCLTCEEPVARSVALRRLQKLTPAAAKVEPKDLADDADQRISVIAALREQVSLLPQSPARTQPAKTP